MESAYDYEGNEIEWTADSDYSGGEIIQLPDGRAGQVTVAVASGKIVAVRTKGVLYDVAKTADVVVIDGGPLWWDHSGNKLTPNEPIGAGDRDFYAGVAKGDATAAATTCGLVLNVQPFYIIDSSRDNGDTVIVKTVVGSTTVEVPNVVQRGGMTAMNFGTTAEAQKVDWKSGRSFLTAAKWVAEILLELVTAADNAAVDVDVGVATDTHATDLGAVTGLATFHLDGDDLNIDMQSDDGVDDVDPDDTGVDIAAGTPVNLTIDGRDHTNCKFYVNGAEKGAATANLGKLTGIAASAIYAIVHAEKTADDSPLVFRARIRVRTMQ